MNESAITGYVYDTYEEGLPGAFVTLEGLAESITLETVTNANGHYAFRGLNLGQFKVTASMTGFKTISQTKMLKLGETYELDFELPVDSVSEVG